MPRKALQYTSQEPSRAGSARGQRLGWRHSNASEQVWSHCAERTSFAQTQFNRKRDWTSVVQKESTTHSQREGVQRWVCKTCLPTGTWGYNPHCIRSLRARRQLLREEELARALVIYRRVCYGCRNVQQQSTCELWKVATGEHHEKTVDKKPTEVKKLKKVNESDGNE